MYRSIDQKKTGIKLKATLKEAGYSVKYIQEYLHLSCPQSIYRWFKGHILPSVEHLCALSNLLGVHMEDLLVLQGQPITQSVKETMDVREMKRLFSYVAFLSKAV